MRPLEGVNFVNLWAGDVVLPKHIKTVQGPEPEYDFIRSAHLARVALFTEELSRRRSIKK